MKYFLFTFFALYSILSLGGEELVKFTRHSKEGDDKRFKLNLQKEEIIEIKTLDTELNTIKSQLISIQTGGLMHVEKVNATGNPERITFKLANVHATFNGRNIQNKLANRKIIANLAGKEAVFFSKNLQPFTKDEKTILSLIFRPAAGHNMNTLFGADTEQLKGEWQPPKEVLMKMFLAEKIPITKANLKCNVIAKDENSLEEPHLLLHYNAKTTQLDNHDFEFEVYLLLPKDNALPERKTKQRYRFTTYENFDDQKQTLLPMPKGTQYIRTSYHNLDLEVIPAKETFSKKSQQQQP